MPGLLRFLLQATLVQRAHCGCRQPCVRDEICPGTFAVYMAQQLLPALLQMCPPSDGAWLHMMDPLSAHQSQVGRLEDCPLSGFQPWNILLVGPDRRLVMMIWPLLPRGMLLPIPDPTGSVLSQCDRNSCAAGGAGCRGGGGAADIYRLRHSPDFAFIELVIAGVCSHLFSLLSSGTHRSLFLRQCRRLLSRHAKSAFQMFQETPADEFAGILPNQAALKLAVIHRPRRFCGAGAPTSPPMTCSSGSSSPSGPSNPSAATRSSAATARPSRDCAFLEGQAKSHWQAQHRSSAAPRAVLGQYSDAFAQLFDLKAQQASDGTTTWTKNCSLLRPWQCLAECAARPARHCSPRLQIALRTTARHVP